MNQQPRILSATPKTEFRVGGHRAVLFADIVPAGRFIGYRHIVAVFEGQEPHPCMFVAAETSSINENSRVAPFLGIFDDAGHHNLGQSEDWADERLFTAKALSLISDRFGTRH